jgi:hypothetical protein
MLTDGVIQGRIAAQPQYPFGERICRRAPYKYSRSTIDYLLCQTANSHCHDRHAGSKGR